MRYFEIVINTRILQNIKLKDMAFKISKAINQYIKNCPLFKEIHVKNGMKLYSISWLKSLSDKKAGFNSMYLKGEICELKIRVMFPGLAKELYDSILETENYLFQITKCNINEVCLDKPIKKISTLTPATLTISSKNSWIVNVHDIEIVKNRIITNTIKKYKELTGDSINYWNFIDDIKVNNKKIISNNYKNNSKILSNKFELKIKQDELSQKLAFVILGAGILEKNSLTFGFCICERGIL